LGEQDVAANGGSVWAASPPQVPGPARRAPPAGQPRDGLSPMVRVPVGRSPPAQEDHARPVGRVGPLGPWCDELIGVGDVETKGYLICCLEAGRHLDALSREEGIHT